MCFIWFVKNAYKSVLTQYYIFRLTVTKETPNKGRQFYVCSKPISAVDKCTFFLWADQPTTSGSSQTQQLQYNNRVNIQNNNGYTNNSVRARPGNS